MSQINATLFKVVEFILKHPTIEQSGIIANICAQDPKLGDLIKAQMQDIENVSSGSVVSLYFPDLKAGYTIDKKYCIEKKLSQGGMGVIYLAKHLGTGRRVVVKLIQPLYSNSPDFIERFRREAGILGQLNHPHIVNITDFGFANVQDPNKSTDSIDSEQNDCRQPYLVMEYLEGLSLADKIAKDKTLSLDLTITITSQVCAALEAAHNQRIIHRDLKPDNIWLQPDGLGNYIVKVLDLGIAKLQSENDSSFHIESENLPSTSQPLIHLRSSSSTQPISSNNAVSLTTDFQPQQNLTKGAIGTFGYMPPEQFNKGVVSPQSDIYSLAITVYQMLTGKLPFSDDVIERQIQLATQECPPLNLELYNIPSSVAEYIRIALNQDPQQRPKTALGFAQGLKIRSQTESILLTEALKLIIDNLYLIPQVIKFYFPFICLLFSLSFLFTNYISNTNAINILIIVVYFFTCSFFTDILLDTLFIPKIFSLSLQNSAQEPSSHTNFSSIQKLTYAYLNEIPKTLLWPLFISSITVITYFFIYFPLLIAMFYSGISTLTITTCFYLAFIYKTKPGEFSFFGSVITIEKLNGKESRDRSTMLAKTSQTIMNKTIFPYLATLTAATIVALPILVIFLVYSLIHNTSGIGTLLASISAVLVISFCIVAVTIFGSLIPVIKLLDYIKARLALGEKIS